MNDRHNSLEIIGNQDYYHKLIADLLAFKSDDAVRNELVPMLERRARRVATSDKAVLIMTVNMGQVDQLINFACSHSEALRHAVIFAADAQVAALLTHLNIEHFYSPKLFGERPREASNAYGDRVFTRMMWMKTAPLLIALHFNYSVLFQDVDVVWFRSPWDAFDDERFDCFFMSEMTYQHRFEPFYFNSGFFYLRNTRGVRAFMDELILQAGLLYAKRSQQMMINHMLGEHHLLLGRLHAHLLDPLDFMNGWFFHRFKERVASNKNSTRSDAASFRPPKAFHMNWTLNSKEKRANWRASRMWFVRNSTHCEAPTVEAARGAPPLERSLDAFKQRCCDAALRTQYDEHMRKYPPQPLRNVQQKF